MEYKKDSLIWPIPLPGTVKHIIFDEDDLIEFKGWSRLAVIDRTNGSPQPNPLADDQLWLNFLMTDGTQSNLVKFAQKHGPLSLPDRPENYGNAKFYESIFEWKYLFTMVQAIVKSWDRHYTNFKIEQDPYSKKNLTKKQPNPVELHHGIPEKLSDNLRIGLLIPINRALNAYPPVPCLEIKPLGKFTILYKPLDLAGAIILQLISHIITKRPYIKYCQAPNCSVLFLPSRHDQITCCNNCRQRRHYHIKKYGYPKNQF